MHLFILMYVFICARIRTNVHPPKTGPVRNLMIDSMYQLRGYIIYISLNLEISIN